MTHMNKYKIGFFIIMGIIICLLVLVITMGVAQAGLPSLFDLNWSFDRAIIVLPNGWSVEGIVQSWKDYENSDVIQVKIGGVTYLTHYSNVVMIDE